MGLREWWDNHEEIVVTIVLSIAVIGFVLLISKVGLKSILLGIWNGGN